MAKKQVESRSGSRSYRVKKGTSGPRQVKRSTPAKKKSSHQTTYNGGNGLDHLGFQESLDRVAILFSGGPAPGGNAVISALATQFLNDGVSVVGLLRGFQYLQQFDPRQGKVMVEGEHYMDLKLGHVTGIRHLGGTILKTSRANPGKVEGNEIKKLSDLKDPAKTDGLRRVIAALKRLRIDALVTIGGDDTLKTANYLRHMGVNVVHVPKTIDNDYYGISWTFGYFTAIDVAKDLIVNLYADARSTNSYFLVECMGRKSGWYTYGAGVAGLAVRMVAVEDIKGKLDVERLAVDLTNLIIQRERMGKKYGVIAVSEGLADLLPEGEKPQRFDEHGNAVLSDAKISNRLAYAMEAEYKRITGRRRKIVPKLVGYETRSAPPCAYDVLLGSQLGMGAYRLVNEGRFGQMVSVGENLQIEAISFDELIDPKTLRARVRFVPTNGDFYKLKQALEFRARTELFENGERVESAVFGNEHGKRKYRQV
ncbi:MAG: 6-phosphofructokinase [Deltaproteobacteria bacterium]|nr:6-phosphofructokinase [Deltaproteobacteria bacterium]